MRLTVLFAASAVLACARQPVGPNHGANDLNFPQLSASVLERYCIRGALLNTGKIEGSIATTDCNKGPSVGYWNSSASTTWTTCGTPGSS